MEAVKSAERKKTKVESGQKFGKWTVLDDVELTLRRERKWLCRCTCGTERYVLERALKASASTSCGCQRKKLKEHTDKAEAKKPKEQVTRVGKHLSDITGRRFSRLVALCATDKRNTGGSVIWKCRCDCGNEVEISYNALMYGNMKSCGCQKKEHDQKLHQFLTHVDGTSLDILKSQKIPENNTTGAKGVYWIHGHYVAKIVFQKKQYYLGAFDRFEDALNARKEAETMLNLTVLEYFQRWNQIAEKDPEWAKNNPVQFLVSLDDQRRMVVECLPHLNNEKESV